VGQREAAHDGGCTGYPLNIFRLGLVWADSHQGRYDELQREYRLFKTCLLSGLAIQSYRYDLAPLPVDYVARAIVSLANRYPNGGGTFHLASSDQAADWVFEQLNEIAGTSLELVPHYEWVCAIKRFHHAGWSLPVVPLVEFAFGMTEAEFHDDQRAIELTRTHVDCARTHRELARAGLPVPRWSEELLVRCVDSMCSRDKELRLWASQNLARSPQRRYG